MPKSDAERAKAYRDRKRASKPPRVKKTNENNKTAAQRAREYRERKKTLIPSDMFYNHVSLTTQSQNISGFMSMESSSKVPPQYISYPQNFAVPSTTRKGKSTAQRMREYRARKKFLKTSGLSLINEAGLRNVVVSSPITSHDLRGPSTSQIQSFNNFVNIAGPSTENQASVNTLPQQDFILYKNGYTEFENHFGSVCSICRLWFRNDVKTPDAQLEKILSMAFPGSDINNMAACMTCRQSLSRNHIYVEDHFNNENKASTAVSNAVIQKRYASPLPEERIKYLKSANEDDVGTCAIVKIEHKEDVCYTTDKHSRETNSETDERDMMCRICLKIVRNIDDDLCPLTSPIYLDTNNGMPFIHYLNIVLSKKITISTDSRFPSHACNECIDIIINSYKLIEQCKKNQESLQEMYGNLNDQDGLVSELKVDPEDYSERLFKPDTAERENLNVAEFVQTDYNSPRMNEEVDDTIGSPCEDYDTVVTYSSASTVLNKKEHTGEEPFSEIPSLNEGIEEENDEVASTAMKLISVGSGTPSKQESCKYSTLETYAGENNQMFTCNDCCSAYIATEEFNKNMEQLYIKVFRCKICKKHFGKESDLENHMKQHAEVPENNSKSSNENKSSDFQIEIKL